MRRILKLGACFCFIVFATVVGPLAAPVMATQEAQHVDPAKSFRVEGRIEKPGEWTPERLAKEFASDVKTVSYTSNGEQGEARCVPLIALIQASKPRISAKIKNHQLAFAIIVHAADGYTAVFSMGELLPSIGKREVWIALDKKGAPLSDKEGPVQLIVPEDNKPSRWVHAIATITILDGALLTGSTRKQP